ncbi:hypothetical protein BD779DRAFT_1763142 [Infundibulicybe gibba]|nr:hypothetical protein BD779DRAFT_1763142 [Infundibulicybe gibba]
MTLNKVARRCEVLGGADSEFEFDDGEYAHASCDGICWSGLMANLSRLSSTSKDYNPSLFPATMPNLFYTLPTEVLTRVLSFLPGIDLESCKLINRDVRDTISSSALLRYIIAADLAGVEDNPHSNLSISEKSTMLAQRELSWRRFQPDFIQSINVDYPTAGIYDFTNGIYFAAASNRPWLHYLELPTVSSQALAWSHIQAGTHHTIIDMAISIYESDLIAIIMRFPDPSLHTRFRIELSFRSFRTGDIHPLASQPTILIELTSQPDPLISIEIVGDLVALAVVHYDNVAKPDDQVSVWNWKTGASLIRVNAPCGTHPSVTFLTEDILLVPNTIGCTFEFWRIPFASEDVSNPISTIALPTLMHGMLIFGVGCRGEPTSLGLSSSLNSDRPFHPSSQQAIMIFHIYIDSISADLRFTLTLVVHRHSLVDLVGECLPQISPEGNRQPLPWESWGPSLTRLFASDMTSTQWITRTAGQRFVSISSTAARSPSPITIYDFNPHNVAKMKNYLEHHPSPNMFYNDREEELEDEAGIFQDPVRSALPYCGTRSEGTYEYNGVLMDEERLLGIKTGFFHEALSIDVMHFG